MNADLTELHDNLADALRSFSLRDFYPDEQRDLQPHLQEVIDAAIGSGCNAALHTVVSVGGPSPKPSVRALGTSFWPDIEVMDGHTPLLGIEVKLVRRGLSASKSLAETIGQSLIYRLRYTRVIAFVLHDGKDDSRLNDHTDTLRELLNQNSITLIVRKRQEHAEQGPGGDSENRSEDDTVPGSPQD